MGEALGMVETKGLVAMIEAADALLVFLRALGGLEITQIHCFVPGGSTNQDPPYVS